MNVTLYNKEDFVYMMTLKILRCVDYPGLSEWIQRHHQGPKCGRGGRRERDDRIRRTQPTIAGFEDRKQTKESG